ncbi:MAG: choice-of-anchor J domain-containing protein [Cyclobacteriaceae bacterium]
MDRLQQKIISRFAYHGMAKIIFSTILFLLCGFFNTSYVVAQERCGTMELEELRREKGLIKYSEAEFEKWIDRRLHERRQRPASMHTMRTSGTTMIIPVVVHIIHSGESIGIGPNISDAQILSQIEVLNEDFNRLNPDTTLTPNEFKPLASQLDIEFVLAKRDPDGQPTNGIVRLEGARTTYSISQLSGMKAESFWPSEDYMNIWVANLSPSSNLGFAQFPDIGLPGLESEPTENRLTDGIVINFRVFGSKDKGSFNLTNNYDKGRTATHEAGHYFGLKHIWGDGNNCTASDHVEDTPNQESATNGCATHPKTSCESVDMFQNYMDYTNDACMNIFTLGQAERMQIVMDNAIRRQSLLTSLGAIPPDTDVYDIAIAEGTSPALISCNQNPVVSVIVQNRGTEPIETYEVSYATDIGIEASVSILDQPLEPGDSELVSFPQISLPDGQYLISYEVRILEPVIDINPANNTLNRVILIDGTTDFIPFREDFEESNLASTNWKTINIDGQTTWQITDAPRTEADNRAAYMNFFNYANVGSEDWLVSPVYDFSDINEATLQFFVAYASNTIFNDQLRLLVSEDCGETWGFPEYEKSGTDLATASSTSNWVPAGEREWRRETVNLVTYIGKSNIRLAFVARNAFGNNLYIDDVELFLNRPGNINRPSRNQVVVFPNPSQDKRFQIVFNNDRRQEVQISIYDSTGKFISQLFYPNTINQSYEFDLVDKNDGLYLIHIVGEDYTTTKRIVLK